MKFFVYTILTFKAYIQSQNVTEKKAAILALTSLVEGPTSERINPILVAALTPLINLMNDSSLKIRETSA